MNKRFECRSCANRQCAAECEGTPKVCLRALTEETNGPVPLWFPVGGSSVAEAMEDKQDKVPEWCKVGNWCFLNSDATDGLSGFAQITEVGKAAIRIRYLTGRMEVIGLNSWRLTCSKPARVRPWTFEEAPMALKIAPVDDPQYTGIVYLNAMVEDGVPVYGYGYLAHNRFHTLEQVAKFAIQLDGFPCGVLEIVNPA